MSKRQSVALPIYVPKEARDKIHEVAKASGYPITADYVRHLIERDMRERGVHVSLEVDRGGDRIDRRAS